MRANRSRRVLAGSALLVLAVAAVAAACGGSAPAAGDAPPTPGARTTIADDRVGPLLNALIIIGATESPVRRALDEIVASGDQRFVAPLIEVLRAKQILLLEGGVPFDEHVAALEALTGEQLGDSWRAWVEWYGERELGLPPGFTSWKGRLLGRIDIQFQEFLNDAHPIRIRPEEIVFGGVLVDGIPPLDSPAMLAAVDATYLTPEDPVFGLVVNGDARAYPLRIMDWHEMMNDVIGGVPVTLAYCTLCGAGIAYDGRGADGIVYTFGTSGLLYRSNKLMYDRPTRTLWNQFTGEPVLGSLATSDAATGEPTVRLRLLPVVLTSWEEWQRQYPETLVLDINTGFDRIYRIGSVYGHYFSSQETMFPVPGRSDQLATKEQVFGLRVRGVPKAYPLEIVTEEVVVNDTIAELPIVLIAPARILEVVGVSRRIGPVTYDAGAEVRAYERGGESFSIGPRPETVVDADGGVWQVGDDALLGPDGQRLERLSGHLAFWFGWFTFFPTTELYDGA